MNSVWFQIPYFLLIFVTAASTKVSDSCIFARGSIYNSLTCQSAMGSVIGRDDSPRASVPETKLEAKIVEAMRRRAKKGSPIRSFDTIVLKFPKIDENMRKCKTTFQEFGTDLLISFYCNVSFKEKYAAFIQIQG